MKCKCPEPNWNSSMLCNDCGGEPRNFCSKCAELETELDLYKSVPENINITSAVVKYKLELSKADEELERLKAKVASYLEKLKIKKALHIKAYGYCDDGKTFGGKAEGIQLAIDLLEE